MLVDFNPPCGTPRSPHAGADDARQYQALRDKACRLLARREHSAWELKRKLRVAARPAQGGAKPAGEHRVDAGIVERLLAELAEQGAQSDARFAEYLCRWRYQNGRGPVKLRHELAEHRIEEAVIARVMAEYDSKWRDLAARVRRRKFGARAPASYREWARQARFLQQRGFAAEQIEPYPGRAVE